MSSNVESLLSAILTGDEKYIVVPQSRVEELLLAIYKNGGGGGGGGTAGIKYLGVIDNYKNLSTTAKKGDYYLAGTANKDKNVHVGDMLIAQKDSPAATIDNSNYRLLHTELDTDTTYTITQDSTDKHTFYFKASTETGTGTKITIPDNDTKTTAASDEKAATKLYLVGTMTQDANGVKTYANAKVYIGTDDCLYSNGKKVAIQEDVDKKVNKTSVSSSNETTSVINVTDAKAQMAMVEKISGKTVKDGDTLKSAVVESLVSQGKNLFNNSVLKMGDVEGNALSANTRVHNGDALFRPFVRKGEKYTISFDNASHGLVVWASCYSASDVYDGTILLNRVSGTTTFTVVNDGYLTVTIAKSTITSTITLNDVINAKIQIERGSTATAYVPHTDNKTTVLVPQSIRNLPDYGVGIDADHCNWVDFENGVYHHDYTSVDLTGKGWISDGNGVFHTSYPTNAKVKAYGICNKFNVTSTKNTPSAVGDMIVRDPTFNVMYVQVTSGSSPDTNGAILYYELADDKKEVIPISDYLRPLPVENGGTLTLVNEHNLDVNSTIKYKKEV